MGSDERETSEILWGKGELRSATFTSGFKGEKDLVEDLIEDVITLLGCF